MAALNDIFQMTIASLCYGQRVMFTQTYRLAAVPVGVSDLDAQQLFIDLTTVGGAHDLVTPYAACLHTGVSVKEVWCQKVWPFRVRATRLVLNPPANGSHGVSTLTQAHVAINLTTNLAGRKQRGTKHVGPIPTEGATAAGGVIHPNALAIYTTFANELVQAVGDAGATTVFLPTLFHRAAGGQFDDVTASHVPDTVRVSRRRTVGLGI